MERIRRFIDDLNDGLPYSLSREVETDARFDQVVEIAKRLEQVLRLEREEREGKRTCGFGGFSRTSFGVAFLGHVVSSEGIKVDPKKIEAVQRWPRPSSAIEIQSFLGLLAIFTDVVISNQQIEAEALDIPC
ncbi:uncharacterized protein [Nicotiana tomentosiformis]|uniref:uncharacterized protein n=1 Tax=Nicotiana tomentosiformis TaxID=4098 RepID=UPI00388C5BF1